MIPGGKFTPQEFARIFPPAGSGRCPPRYNGFNSEEPPSIINDIPIKAKSCFVYDIEVLKTYRGDNTYPIPDVNQFSQGRELISLEAVVKRIGPGKSVFSHMYVAPEDVQALFGDDFVSTLGSIQTDVRTSCIILAKFQSYLGRDYTRNHLKPIPA
jgi:hypothetical protein